MILKGGLERLPTKYRFSILSAKTASLARSLFTTQTQKKVWEDWGKLSKNFEASDGSMWLKII